MKRFLLLAAGALVLAVGASGAPMVSGAQAADKKINLKLSYWVPPRHFLTPGYEEWAKALSEKTHGTVTVKLYPSSQLGSGRDHYDMVKRGIADFGLINPGYTPGRFPVLGAVDLPFTITNSLKAAPALTAWYQKYAKKEMSDVHLCHVFTHDIATIHSNKPIKVPSDVKGLNIRSANQTMSRFVTALGGNPVQVPIMEAKETLKKGITDGITVTLGGLEGTFKFKDVTKYTLDIPLYVSTFTHVINKRTYRKMSKSQRAAVDSLCTPEWSAKVYKYWYDADQIDQKNARKLKDHVFTEVTPAELKMWRQAAKPVEAEWAESVKKKGYNPDKVLKELHAALRKAGALYE